MYFLVELNQGFFEEKILPVLRRNFGEIRKSKKLS
jgi:hypothetical protein